MYLMKIPSDEQFREVSEHFSCWMLVHTWGCHPVWSLSCAPSLSPLLRIGCLATRIKYRPTLSKLSILSIQNPSVFPTMLFLSLSFVVVLLLRLSASFSFILPTPHAGDFRDFRWRHGKHSSNSTSRCCQRRFSQWVTWWPSEGVCWEVVCVHPRNTQGARSALCSFIQLGVPTYSEGYPLLLLPVKAAFDSQRCGSITFSLPAPFQG